MRKMIPSLVASLLALALPSLAIAAEFKIATVAPEGSQWMQEMRAAAADIKARTAGRAIVKLYGGGAMGNEKQVLRKIRIGQLQGGAFTANGIAEKYPDIVIYGLPLVFQSQDEVTYVRQRMDGKLADGLERAGFVSFGIAGGGFAQIFANRPITSTSDMRGLKIWVPEGDRISTAAMDALHLSPVSLPVTDVLTGLQTGLLDVVAAPPVAVIALQWHTRVKTMTRLPLMYTMGVMAIDEAAFSKLTPADQAAFREVMSGVYRRLDEHSPADDAAALQALEAAGIKSVIANPADVRSWNEAVAGANRRLGEQGVYDPALFAELQGHLQEYRRQHPQAAGSPPRS
jgi:TRAP-type C4-dicarboxylate transport system substrate-binding protein